MIKIKCFTAILILGLGHSFLVAAQTVKNGSSYLKMIEASTQRTIPGVRGAEPVTKTSFLLVWKNNAEPTTFFWRGSSGWMTCNIQKAHKPIKKNKITGDQYTLEMIRPGTIKKGDTLLISPMSGGKYAIPKEIPLTAVNTLFFKTAKSTWLKYPVKKFEKKQDIVMP